LERAASGWDFAPELLRANRVTFSFGAHFFPPKNCAGKYRSKIIYQNREPNSCAKYLGDKSENDRPNFIIPKKNLSAPLHNFGRRLPVRNPPLPNPLFPNESGITMERD